MKQPAVNLDPLPPVPDPAEVRDALARVLNCPSFRGSKRSQDFLQYVVSKVLEGDGETLKERTLATEVFGRAAAGDLGSDSIVRVGAREVRKRLAQYYVAEGAHDLVRIDIPPGSYTAVFHYAGTVTEPSVEAVAVAPAPLSAAPLASEPSLLPKGLIAPKEPEVRLRPKLMWQVAVAGIACLAAGGWFLVSPPIGPFEVFWAPVFVQKSPVALLLAHPIVYHPSTRAKRLDEEINGIARSPLQHAVHIPPDLLDGSDYVPVTEQYVGFGDTVAALRLTALFAQHGNNTRARLASKVEFNDLVGSGAILVGAFTNRWTAELTKNLRFHFAYDQGKPCILDTATGKTWRLSGKTDDGKTAEDYILLCRLPHSGTGGFVVVCAGLAIYGTEEAGRILAEPDLLTPILRRLPSDWAAHNLELVLHLDVIGDAPALPELVARHSW